MSDFFRYHKSIVVQASGALRSHAGWIALLLVNLLIVLSLRAELISPKISGWVPQLALNLYLLVVYIYGQLRIKPVERFDFMQLIWQMLLFGVLAVSFSFFIEAVYYIFHGQAFFQSGIAVNVVYLLSLTIISTYLVLLLVAFKRLVLYEKSRLLQISWKIFEYSLISSMVLGVFNIEVHTIVFNAILLGLIGMGVLLSVNLKWVGYLDFNQKWKSLLILMGIVACLSYFFFFATVYQGDKAILLNMVDDVFLLALLAFCVFYSLLSCLVIFFNLPTSSVYEKKLQEIKGFHKLNRSNQKEETEENIWQSLLENSLSAVDADAGWLEIKKEGGEVHLLGQIEEEELNEVIDGIRKAGIQKVFKADFTNKKQKSHYLGGLAHSVYRTIMVVPLTLQEEHSGLLVLLKDVEGGFNKDAVDLVKTYADHSCTAIENGRLLKEALQNERYKEELTIARRVQRSLLPEKLEHHEDFNLAVHSESSDVVGGDYYDTFKLNEQQYALVIADVAGHGTAAAFAMSQLKGVLHSLVHLGYSGKELVVRVNQALSKCLDKATFITLTYVMVDVSSKKIELLRAGHCPALFWQQEAGELKVLNDKSMGIGILRNEQFAGHLQENYLQYTPGDVLVLYTDGVVESKNEQQEEFGQERLQEIVVKNVTEDAVDLQNKVMEALREHTKKTGINDDFTTMIVKFS
ncbi:SpoIIE family protein phosphatase [Nafulsella turpanensis]|uniref:SpoIIE family protein phosphatase n=1 Tax=Nafulsella turpanensis TaxID=1265690 RepID=UPI000349CDD7|nr:SpoIIE family protein phosphatase [Nafulsella turpanensis]